MRQVVWTNIYIEGIPPKFVRLGAKPMAEKIIESKKHCIWMDAGVIEFQAL